MKPKNNKVYCYGCQRRKMLFETKAKADNFIKYNKDNILEERGYAPVRSYYCEFCCGYHVTSNTSTVDGEWLNEKDHEILMQFDSSKLLDSEFGDFYTKAISKIEQAENKLLTGDFKEIEVLHEEIENLRTKYKVLHHLPYRKREKFLELNKKIDSLEELAIKVKAIIEKDDEDISSYLSLENPTDEQNKLISFIRATLLIRHVVREIKKIETIVEEGDVTKAYDLKEELRLYVSSKENLKNSRTECNKRINELESKIAKKKKELQANISIAEEEVPIFFSPKNQESYQSTILEIINILEEIKSLYDTGNIDSCETKIDIADYILNEINTEDENTEILKSHIDKWKLKINNSAP